MKLLIDLVREGESEEKTGCKRETKRNEKGKRTRTGEAIEEIPNKMTRK